MQEVGCNSRVQNFWQEGNRLEGFGGDFWFQQRQLVGLVGNEFGSSYEFLRGFIGYGKGFGYCFFFFSGKLLWGKVKQRKDWFNVCESFFWMFLGGEMNGMGRKRNMGLRLIRIRGWVERSIWLGMRFCDFYFKWVLTVIFIKVNNGFQKKKNYMFSDTNYILQKFLEGFIQ